MSGPLGAGDASSFFHRTSMHSSPRIPSRPSGLRLVLAAGAGPFVHGNRLRIARDRFPGLRARQTFIDDRVPRRGARRGRHRSSAPVWQEHLSACDRAQRAPSSRLAQDSTAPLSSRARKRRRQESGSGSPITSASCAGSRKQSAVGQFPPPRPVVGPWIAMNRLVSAAVNSAVALFVAFQPVGTDPHRCASHGLGDRTAAAGACVGNGLAGQYRPDRPDALLACHHRAVPLRSCPVVNRASG